MKTLATTKKTLWKVTMITILIYSIMLSCNAEYRVYQYFVKSKSFKAQDNGSYIVTTSLNPVTYRAYHGGQETITLDSMRTWICPGYTGKFKQYCPSPYSKLLSRELANNEGDNNES